MPTMREGDLDRPPHRPHSAGARPCKGLPTRFARLARISHFRPTAAPVSWRKGPPPAHAAIHLGQHISAR